MDSLNSDGSGALALEPLCQVAAQELLMRSYTVRILNRYKRVWEQLAEFARAQGQLAASRMWSTAQRCQPPAEIMAL